jgi:hypothetical protein
MLLQTQLKFFSAIQLLSSLEVKLVDDIFILPLHPVKVSGLFTEKAIFEEAKPLK